MVRRKESNKEVPEAGRPSGWLQGVATSKGLARGGNCIKQK